MRQRKHQLKNILKIEKRESPTITFLKRKWKGI